MAAVFVSEDGAVGEMEAVVSAAARDGNALRWAADGTGETGVSVLPGLWSRLRREASSIWGGVAFAWAPSAVASDDGVLGEIEAVVSLAERGGGGPCWAVGGTAGTGGVENGCA